MYFFSHEMNAESIIWFKLDSLSAACFGHTRKCPPPPHSKTKNCTKRDEEQSPNKEEGNPFVWSFLFVCFCTWIFRAVLSFYAVSKEGCLTTLHSANSLCNRGGRTLVFFRNFQRFHSVPDINNTLFIRYNWCDVVKQLISNIAK